MRPDIQRQVDEESADEHEKCQARRTRVLAHPDIAARLCLPPFELTKPEYWNGYIPPQYHMGKPNNSPVRKQLLDICWAVQKREENPGEDRPPVAPEYITTKQLTMLHICLEEYGITDRGEKLLYLTGEIDREVESSKELHKDEASRLIDKLTQLVKLEMERNDEAETTAEVPAVDSEPGHHGDAGGTGPTDWGEDGEPPY